MNTTENIKTEKKSENSRLSFRVPQSTKDLFLNNFKISNYKLLQDFFLSLLNFNDGSTKPNDVFDQKAGRITIQLRVTAKEKEEINTLFNGSSEKRIGTFILNCVKNAPITVENITVLGEELSIELNKIGTNLNQIALRANQHGMIDKEAILLLNEIKMKLSTLTNLK